MKSKLWVLCAMTLVAGAGLTAAASAGDSGYDSDPYAVQTAHDAFGFSVKQRLQLARFPGAAFGGGMSLAPLRSDAALAATPSARGDAYGSRRLIDCGDGGFSGLSVWGGGYGAWSKQRMKDGHDGYKYRVVGPVVGLDWSNGAFTVGAATTFGWGRLNSSQSSRNTRTFGVMGYGQWTNQQIYVNGAISYGYNRFGNIRRNDGANSFSANNYHSNSWDVAVEGGYKFRLANFFTVTPNVGLRYFHDDSTNFSEYITGGSGTPLSIGGRNYHVLELPVGVDLGYEINTGGMVLIPHAGFTWTPELDRKRGTDTNGNIAPRRGRNGYTIAGGFQARFSQSVSAGIDYNCELRDNKYEHRLNLGVGFTF